MSKLDFGPSKRILAIGEVVLAAIIWATSFVAVKYALSSVPPLTLAGLRFFLAFLILVPALLWEGKTCFGWKKWTKLALMGLLQYTVGNGALFSALKTLSSTAGALSLSLVPLATAWLEVLWLKERLNVSQLGGVLIAVSGSVLFFARKVSGCVCLQGLGLLGVAVMSIASFFVLLREMSRTGRIGSIALTAWPLGFGGAGLLVLAFPLEGVPHLSLSIWEVVLGMAVVNTVFAFLLYTHAVQHLKATEASVILNLSPLGTALLAWGTLGEAISPTRLGAICMVILGAVFAQRRR